MNDVSNDLFILIFRFQFCSPFFRLNQESNTFLFLLHSGKKQPIFLTIRPAQKSNIYSKFTQGHYSELHIFLSHNTGMTRTKKTNKTIIKIIHS